MSYFLKIFSKKLTYLSICIQRSLLSFIKKLENNYKCTFIFINNKIVSICLENEKVEKKFKNTWLIDLKTLL